MGNLEMFDFILFKNKQIEPMIDLHRKKASVKTDASRVAGAVHLEILPSNLDGRSPCVLLTSRYWKKIYLVNFRHGWDDEKYFALAEQIFHKRGILNP